MTARSASWTALPRKPPIAEPIQPVHIDATHEFLEAHCVSDPKVRITRILLVDLDGDGEDEALISATNYFTEDGGVPMDTPAPGSYSIVLLRRVVAGKAQTEFVAGQLYPKDQDTPNVYEIPAVLDLNGDGKLEVIVDSQYYEGAASTIYDCSGGKCKEVLS